MVLQYVHKLIQLVAGYRISVSDFACDRFCIAMCITNGSLYS